MARKPTIFKFAIALADADAGRYLDLNLTVAQHPSESIERMMVRVLAYCLHAREGLEFTRGLSDTDEPDVWERSLDGRIIQWIEVGEPTVERLRKASGVADCVRVYSFNSKSDAWWRQVSAEMIKLGVAAHQFRWDEIKRLASMVQRTLALSLSITGMSAFLATDSDSIELNWRALSG